jgi:hypothetical protein
VAKGETCVNCPDDCGSCTPVCGNSKCEAPYESCSSCPSDCGPCCGNGTCDQIYGETCNSCPGDCGPCSCGNGQCETSNGEDCQNCSKDCGKCEAMCQSHSWPGCDGCACESCVCSVLPSCCSSGWNSICVAICQYYCQGPCP